ncbi:MAG: hypothetical protein GX333_06835 [Syntrophomonadaceae bacterium]|nr:hypothetical protein [Syntrophomonadaceae bacterium]
MKQVLSNEILENNRKKNNYRVMLATTIIVSLMILVTAILEVLGIATKAINIGAVAKATAFSFIIGFLLWKYIAKYGVRPYSKWLVISIVFIWITALRTVPHDAPESYAIYYLLILMSVFYFDLLLVIFSTTLCILGDLLLLHYYPTLYPDGSLSGTLVIRYFCFLWIGIAAAFSSYAIKELILLNTSLSIHNLKLKEDVNRKTHIDNMRKEFIAAVSHELKTPISIIEGYAEGLNDGIVEENEKNEFINIIIDESQKMKYLVEDMLDLTKFEYGFLKITWEDFSLNDLLLICINKFKLNLKEKDLEIQINLEKDYIVSGDTSRIENVVINLLSNAIRHSPEGSVIKIIITDKIDQVLIKIQNNTNYFTKEEKNLIWDAFYRVEKSRNRKFGGTGLGLAVVKTILELHASDFGVNNTDLGVEFYFTLNKSINKIAN